MPVDLRGRGNDTCRNIARKLCANIGGNMLFCCEAVAMTLAGTSISFLEHLQQQVFLVQSCGKDIA